MNLPFFWRVKMNYYWLTFTQTLVNLFFLKLIWFKLIFKKKITSFRLFFKFTNKLIFKKTPSTNSLFFYKILRSLNSNFLKMLNYFKNQFIFLLLNDMIFSNFLIKYFKIKKLKRFNFSTHCLQIFKKIWGEGFIYLRGLFLLFFIDACITDDEPLWEPLEWSLIQTWIFFIFIFAWIAENLITSRYGAYTGRDKKVWFAWYKTFWLIEGWYLLTYISASCFVIVPFYYEITYNISFVFSWWHWYTKIFFYKFISFYSCILLLSQIFLINIRWLNWKKLFFYVLLINISLSYLLYTHFISSFFAYFTDPLWYQKTRLIDYIQNSHEPLKWGWGPSKRDHFSYHKTSTVFWFKNDNPFAGSFLMIHLFFFLTLFFLYLYWLTLLRKIYATKEASFTFSTYCVSALRQFFFIFLLLYTLIFLSFIISYWRFPIEFIWTSNSLTWFNNFLTILKDFFQI